MTPLLTHSTDGTVSIVPVICHVNGRCLGVDAQQVAGAQHYDTANDDDEVDVGGGVSDQAGCATRARKDRGMQSICSLLVLLQRCYGNYMYMYMYHLILLCA